MNALNEKVLKYIEAKQQGKNINSFKNDIKKFLTKNSVSDKVRISVNKLINDDDNISYGGSETNNTESDSKDINTFVIIITNKHYEMIKNGLYIFMDNDYIEFPLKTIVIGSRRLQVSNMMELFESDDLEYIYFLKNNNKYCFVCEIFKDNLLTELNMLDKSLVQINNTIESNNNKSRSYEVVVNDVSIYYDGKNNQPHFSKLNLYFSKE